MHIDDWSVMATGDSGDINLERAVLRGLQKMYATFVKKNHDYGPKNISAGGIVGIVLRMGDKIARVWNLVGLPGKASKVHDESTQDTLLDLANYALYGYLMTNGSWPPGSINDSLDIVEFMRARMSDMPFSEVADIRDAANSILVERLADV